MHSSGLGGFTEKLTFDTLTQALPDNDEFGALPAPNNRTMENFFRGSWAYHIHNQV